MISARAQADAHACMSRGGGARRGRVHTCYAVPHRSRYSHHVLQDRVITTNDWSSASNVEQLLLDGVDHFIRCLTEEIHDDLSDFIAVLLCSLILSLLNSLQEIKLTFRSCMLASIVLVNRVDSGKLVFDHEMLHDGSNLPAEKGARPANSQQIDEPADTTGLNLPHYFLTTQLAKKCCLFCIPSLDKQRSHDYVTKHTENRKIYRLPLSRNRCALRRRRRTPP